MDTLKRVGGVHRESHYGYQCSQILLNFGKNNSFYKELEYHNSRFEFVANLMMKITIGITAMEP